MGKRFCFRICIVRLVSRLHVSPMGRGWIYYAYKSPLGMAKLAKDALRGHIGSLYHIEGTSWGKGYV